MKTLSPLASIVGTGLRCSLGLDAMQSSFMYRAGMSGLRECPILDPDGEPVTMGCFAPLPVPLVGADRLLELALPALSEAVAPLVNELRSLRCKLVLLGDEPIGQAPVLGPEQLPRLRNALYAQLETNVPVETVAGGAGGIGDVLESAFEQFSNGALDAVILGGLHTDYDLARLHWLAGEQRLFTTSQLDALLPGEAAAFLVVVKPGGLAQAKLKALAHLVGVAHAREKARFDNDEAASEAGALTVCVRRAAAPLIDAKQKLGWFWTDANLEVFRVQELQSILARTQHLFDETQVLEAPAQRLGDLGAASAPVHLSLAVEAWRRNHAPGKAALSTTGSDGGARTALIAYQP